MCWCFGCEFGLCLEIFCCMLDLLCHEDIRNIGDTDSFLLITDFNIHKTAKREEFLCYHDMLSIDEESCKYYLPETMNDVETIKIPL